MRIWVTGVGIVSPLGAGARATMDRLLAGDRAQRTVTLFDTAGCRSSIAAEIDLRAADVAPRGAVAEWSRTDAMALVAAREALAQGKCEGGVDLIVGGTTAGMFETENLLAMLHREPHAGEPLSRMLTHPLSATADRLREAIGGIGRASTICSACSSGANALIVAASWIESGRSERVLAGGADGLCRLTYTGFSCLGALSAEPCRPFDERRDGLNLGEGAGFLLLESEASARTRGAEPIAELRGFAALAEAHHITNPEASGATAAAVMRRAIARGGLAPDDIGYVNAHGTATKLNDAMESAALASCFGARAAELAVSSTKGAIGHTLGAAGAIEAVIAALSLAGEELPPTAGLEQIDRECRLGHVVTRRRARIDAAMSSSFGFGGSDVVVVVSRPGAFGDPAPRPRRRVMVSAAGTIGALGVGDSAAAALYLTGGGTAAAVDPKDYLDVEKARRLDRAGRLVAVAIQTALAEAGGDAVNAGAIAGGAFGSIDDCAAFVDRFLAKGARFATPAIFPSLLPSSPVGHASIYLGMHGPVFSSHDLAATAESAIVLAAELIAAGEAERMAAGAVEQKSALTEAVLTPLYGPPASSRHPRESGDPAATTASSLDSRFRGNDGRERERGEGTAVLLLDGESTSALAELVWWRAWRGDGAAAIAELPAPVDPARALVATAREQTRDLGPWQTVARKSAAAVAGDHEAAGGFAAAAAVGLIAAGSIDEALVVATAPDRGYLLLFRRAAGTR